MKFAANRPARLLAACAVAAVFAAGAAQAQQRCQTASKFGPNDEIGNLNHVTPAKTLAASKLVTQGQGVSPRHRDEQGHARLPATHLLDHHPSAGPDRRRQPRTDQDHLQRRHHQWLGRHRLAARRPGPHRHRRSLLQLQQGRRVRNDRRPEEARHREGARDRHARRAARHGRLLQYRHRQGRHGVQPRGDRRRDEAPGRQADREGRRGALLHRLDQADRQGQQALRRRWSPGSA